MTFVSSSRRTSYLTIKINIIFACCLVEFVVVHNGIITNYKDIKKFLVSHKINF